MERVLQEEKSRRDKKVSIYFTCNTFKKQPLLWHILLGWVGDKDRLRREAVNDKDISL